MVLDTSRIDPVLWREMSQVHTQMNKVSHYNNLPLDIRPLQYFRVNCILPVGPNLPVE